MYDLCSSHPPIKSDCINTLSENSFLNSHPSPLPLQLSSGKSQTPLTHNEHPRQTLDQNDDPLPLPTDAQPALSPTNLSPTPWSAADDSLPSKRERECEWQWQQTSHDFQRPSSRLQRHSGHENTDSDSIRRHTAGSIGSRNPTGRLISSRSSPPSSVTAHHTTSASAWGPAGTGLGSIALHECVGDVCTRVWDRDGDGDAVERKSTCRPLLGRGGRGGGEGE